MCSVFMLWLCWCHVYEVTYPNCDIVAIVIHCTEGEFTQSTMVTTVTRQCDWDRHRLLQLIYFREILYDKVTNISTGSQIDWGILQFTPWLLYSKSKKIHCVVDHARVAQCLKSVFPYLIQQTTVVFSIQWWKVEISSTFLSKTFYTNRWYSYLNNRVITASLALDV